MKIKTWMATFYVLILVLIIIFSMSLLYILKSDYIIEKKKKNLDFGENFKKYEVLLNNPNLYTGKENINIKIDEEDNSYTVIELYTDKGILLYSSDGSEVVGESYNIDTLYRGLYSVYKYNNKISTKRLVRFEERIVGIYKITVINDNLLEFNKDTLNLIIIGFIFVALLIVLFISKIMNKKITEPIKGLTFAMKEFGEGKDINIRCSSRDEIGMLVKEFNKMKEEILEKNNLIQKEQKARQYVLAAISHDLKTPLTSIRVYTELLSNDTDQKSREKYTNIMLDRCDYMKGMIENLLMYTILTSGYSKNFVKVEGEEFFDMLFDGYYSVCKLKGVKLHSYVKCSGEYMVNVNEMIRVIDNLISNAINYTEVDKNIWLGAFSKEHALMDWVDEEFREDIDALRLNGVVIIVKNEGRYISDEEVKNIFKPFYKHDKSRQSSGGTGLGLSIVKLIIEQHGGGIRLFSKKESGNLFVCFLKNAKL